MKIKIEEGYLDSSKLEISMDQELKNNYYENEWLNKQPGKIDRKLWENRMLNVD